MDSARVKAGCVCLFKQTEDSSVNRLHLPSTFFTHRYVKPEPLPSDSHPVRGKQRLQVSKWPKITKPGSQTKGAAKQRLKLDLPQHWPASTNPLLLLSPLPLQSPQVNRNVTQKHNSHNGKMHVCPQPLNRCLTFHSRNWPLAQSSHPPFPAVYGCPVPTLQQGCMTNQLSSATFN